MVSFAAAVLVVAFLYFLGDWISTLPTVAIAAILIFTGITLIDVREPLRLKRLHPFSALLSLITSVAVIALGVLPGILLGVLLSLFRLLSQIARPHDALLGRVRRRFTTSAMTTRPRRSPALSCIAFMVHWSSPIFVSSSNVSSTSSRKRKPRFAR